jgi:hypothetical protein
MELQTNSDWIANYVFAQATKTSDEESYHHYRLTLGRRTLGALAQSGIKTGTIILTISTPPARRLQQNLRLEYSLVGSNGWVLLLEERAQAGRFVGSMHRMAIQTPIKELSFDLGVLTTTLTPRSEPSFVNLTNLPLIQERYQRFTDALAKALGRPGYQRYKI